MKVGEYTKIISGFAFDSQLFNSEGLGDPLIRIRDVGKSETETFFDGEYPEHAIVNNGDFLIGMDGDFRLAEWHGGRALLNQRVCKIVPNESIVSSGYIMRLLPAELKRIEDRTSFATVKHLSVKKIKEINIPLPPLEVQKKIAAILDAADELRQKDKALVAKYDELTQSLFLDMFGDPVTNPKRWKRESLGAYIEFLTSGSRGWAKYYSDKGDVFLRIQNVGYDRLKLDDLTFVQAPASAESKRTRVQQNDVILSITADLGRTGVIPAGFPNAHINQHLAILRLRNTVNPYFISAYIASKGGQSLFLKLDKGGVKAGLNFADIKSYSVFCPPIELQRAYMIRSEAIHDQKSIALDSLNQSDKLFNSLLQKAFKGELTN